MSLSIVLLRTAIADETLRYNRDIRPILAEHCFACHGFDEGSRAAGLRLDVRQEAIDSGALVAGSAAESLLVERVLSQDPETVMPPPEHRHTLSADQKDLLVRWIDEGAVYEGHWAFSAPVQEMPPDDAGLGWAKNTVDQFVAKSHLQAGLTPAPEAEPRAFFRRLHFDITGLPPTVNDTNEYVQDYASGGDEIVLKWIDRLMRTPAWGEHRARYWLDAATRYSDTHGMHRDNYREIWAYRDWVISAFNANMPFDQFITEQLAGDLLPEATISQKVATGFQRCVVTTNEGGTIVEENIATYNADRVQTYSWTFLGLTMNCCQCHDHKFDPLSAKDYYSMVAFFGNTLQGGMDQDSKEGGGPVVKVYTPEDQARLEQLRSEIRDATEKQLDMVEVGRSGVRDWATNYDRETGLAKLNTRDQLAHVPNLISVDEKGEPIEKYELPENFGSLGHFAANQPFSVSIWLKTNIPAQHAALIAKMDVNGNYRGWDLHLDTSGRLSFHFIDNWPASAIKVATLEPLQASEQLQHICVTYDGSARAERVAIYLNGEKQKTRSDADSLATTSETTSETALKLGQRSQGDTLTNASLKSLRLYNRQLNDSFVREIYSRERIGQLLEDDFDQLTDDQREVIVNAYLLQTLPTYAELTDRVTQIRAELDAIDQRTPISMVQEERTDRPAVAKILTRGAYDAIGEEVSAMTPSVLHHFKSEWPANRLGLARWTVDRSNPLTSRVLVNRFWQEIFGTGIVATPEDFGVMGTPPTHPELLDWLAVEFINSGWDVQHLFKLILTSATYRQSSTTSPKMLELDASNSMLARGPRFRMDGEMIRDAALASCGLLSQKMFGPGTRPVQPDHLWDAVGLPDSNTRAYRVDAGEDLYRRSIYTFWKRMSPPPNLGTFDAPTREVCVIRRERTNTPLQALVALNDPQFVEAARGLAQIVLAQETQNEGAILQSIALRVLARRFNSDELESLLADHGEFARHYREHPEDANAFLKVGAWPLDDKLDAAVLAAWTMTCNQVLNLDETLTK